MGAVHQTLGWVGVVICGLVGVWGLALHRLNTLPRAFLWSAGGAIVIMLVQVLTGLLVMSVDRVEPGSIHVFYGVVIAVTFTFAYIYRVQFRKRPALAYGLLLLFVMGLGIRGMTAFGVNF